MPRTDIKDYQSIANRLMNLHLDLEAKKKMDADWRLARGLEDRIGAEQHSTGDLDAAERLLAKYGL